MKESLRDEVLRYAKRKYGSDAEYLWERYPTYAIVRHQDNQKWYGLIMNIPGSKLGLNSDEIVDVLNLKLGDLLLCDLLQQQEGYFPGYHLSKADWISVLLDVTVPIK